MSKRRTHGTRRDSDRQQERQRADRTMNRRAWLGAAASGLVMAGAGGLLLFRPRAAGAQRTPIHVWASPTCGCCKEWMRNLNQSGFIVTVDEVDDVSPYKQQYGVPQSLWACHTALVGPYVIEGHVPADVIANALLDRPAIAGLGTPGMPMGAPGMDENGGGSHERYNVMSFDAQGNTAIYAVR